MVEVNQTHNLEEVPECVMNAAVRAYEPTLEDTFFVIPSGDYQRLIFTGLQLRDREENALNEFRTFLKGQNLTLPDGYDDETRLVLRFLQKMHWDQQKTYDAIVENHTWKLQVNVTDFAPVSKELNQGWLYAYKRDKSLRPVVIVNVRGIINSQVSIEHLVVVADYFLHYVITKGMVPGKIENWTAIFDMRDVGVTELPSKHIQRLVASMSKNYCGRMFKFFATDCNWLVRSMMYMVHKFVDEFTKRKLLTFSDDYQPDLHKIVDVESLESKYGGKLPNKTADFWPPQLN